MTKLIPFQKIPNNDLAVLDQQIQARKDLIMQMVGELYPRALREETAKLANIRDELLYNRAFK